ncbi:MAG: CIA30 family protein [Bacteroidia bacterium]|nr:CIA30 family protein [Bacteroidia bacterium]
MTLMPPIIFDFSEDANLSGWYVVDDGVMGGLSAGQLSISPEGHGIFQGYVSLENNGGFSSIRYRMQPKRVDEYNQLIFKVKGDGKPYQIRVKSSWSQRYSYASEIQTNGEWQTISVELSEMTPTFRGRRLNMDNYPVERLAELAILVGNKKEEKFKLEIDSIELK